MSGQMKLYFSQVNRRIFNKNQSVFESGDICSSAEGIPESLAEQPESRLTEKEISKLVQDEQYAPSPLGTRVVFI